MKLFLKIIKIFFSISLVFYVFVLPVKAQEVDSLTLTISPPLIKIKMNAGGDYNGFIRVVNNNSHKVNVYVQAQNFRSNNEGMVEFVSKEEEAAYQYSLSQWLEFNQGPIEIPAQESQDVPFSIHLPRDASPGGYYSALLVGTKPPENISGTGIKISSLLASLIMLEVSGDVLVKGEIREFSTDKKFYNEPRVKFTVNFANLGNIHLQPRGEINVYNIFNQEVGKIEINRKTEFGNVLPQSNRKWEFNWADKKKLLNMGRYRAVLLLSYNGKEGGVLSETLTFWVLYPKLILFSTGITLILIILFAFLIKRYVRLAVLREQANLGVVVPPNIKTSHRISVIPADNDFVNGKKTSSMIIELKSGQKDKTRTKGDDVGPGISEAKKIFLAGLIAFILVGLAVYLLVFFGYLNFNNFPWQGSKDNTIFKEVDNKESRESNNLPETVEVMKLEEQENKTEDSNIAVNNLDLERTENEEMEIKAESMPIIVILNGSGIAGAAGRAEKILTAAGFSVKSIGNADHYNYLNTIIRHKQSFRSTAEKISSVFKGEVELEEIKDSESDIIIIIGKNFQ